LVLKSPVTDIAARTFEDLAEKLAT
jgi:hypothetical protein